VSETELLLPDGFAPERLSSVLSNSGLLAEAVDSGSGTRIYYDTFDGRLRAAGVPAVYEHGRLVLNGVTASLQPPPDRLLAAELEPGPFRDALAPLVDVRALLPVAELNVSERRLRILDDERKTVVRASIEQPTLTSSGTQLKARLRLVAVRGYDAELERVCATLERELGLERPARSLIDEAVGALGGAPGGVSSKVEVELDFGQRADTGAVVVLRRLLGVVDQNLEGALADLDSEFLHDLRVAIRRSRSVQRQLKGVFPPEELARFRTEFRWVQQVTGDARDLDVYMLEFEDMCALVPAAMRADLEPLHELLSERRVQARERMAEDLRSRRFAELRPSWSGLLDGLVALPEADRHAAATPIGTLAGRRIAKVYGRMVKEGAAIDQHGPSEPFHELRKRGKELRYLLELFGTPLYPAEVVKPMIKTLKGLQDVLGRHQDREVQVATLGSLARELPQDAGALLATGALIARLDDDKWAARGDFDKRFSAFSSADQRALVRDTFG
jgi:CHAD domain-containing protein